MIPYIQLPIKMNKKTLMQSTVNKYIFFAWTLEWLARYRFFKNEKVIDLKIIEENIHKCGLLTKKEATPNDISHWLQEMQTMQLIGLIKIVDTDQEGIEMYDAGYEAYKNQTFQSMAVNLLEAHESRKMANLAVIVAILSIVITVVLAIL